MGRFNKWEEIITETILAVKEFGVEEVNNLESLQCLFFEEEKYPAILDLINNKNWEGIKNISNPDNKKGFREYLDIVKFTNQRNDLCIATIYDSDELMQDPQIIDIISFD